MPSKKPLGIEDQKVYDENGKRRFHGAFTGGFSAGYWNTVGSQEGWKPTEFKSTRAEKASLKFQRPEDFMDDEDLGEFGIAPQRLQTTEDFTSKTQANKRKFKQPSDGPIPGIPVLHQLLEPARENIAIRLLKKMGWKEGQGVGARMTRKEKKLAEKRNEKELYVMKMYGCEITGNTTKKMQSDDENDDSDDSDIENITFAPDDFEPFILALKENTFGLGYVGLSKEPVLQQHVNLFSPFEVLDKNNKKLSISGQGFGVGAMEEDDDEDVYAKDDMGRYDFTLDNSKKGKPKKKEEPQNLLIVDGFEKPNSGESKKRPNQIYKVELSIGFKPKNWGVRKSRFEPIDEVVEQQILEQNHYKKKGIGRHDLNPEERGNLLNERKEKPKPSLLEIINSKSFVKEGEDILKHDVQKEKEELQKEAAKITQHLDPKTGAFKPFVMDSDKQIRYDSFLMFSETGNEAITKFMNSIQPVNLSEWEREMEKKEFIQAKKLFKPLVGMMSDRFVTEGLEDLKKSILVETTDKVLKMERTKAMWKPSSILCKRFNIPEPYGGSIPEAKTKKKNKFSVFDYLESSVHNRNNFVTPVIIPDRIIPSVETIKEVPKILDASSDVRTSSSEIFTKEVPLKTKIPERNHSMKKIEKKIEKKSELEIKVQENINKPPAEKKDLFKAIFDSSGESEEENTPEEETQDERKKRIVEALNLNQSASEINLLRNTSPPRGIFANLFTPSTSKSNIEIPIQVPEIKIVVPDCPESVPVLKFRSKFQRAEEDLEVIKFRSKSERSQIAESPPKKNVEEELYFGPKLPDIIKPVVLPEEEENEIDNRLQALFKKANVKTIVEEWVEKEKKKKKKDKKHKKSKKHKKDKK